MFHCFQGIADAINIIQTYDVPFEKLYCLRESSLGHLKIKLLKKIRETSRLRVFSIELVSEQTELRRKSTSLT